MLEAFRVSISRSRKPRKWPEREKRGETETNFRPSSNRPWWSDKHRKRWVYHLRSYPLKSSFHLSLSFSLSLFYPTKRRRNFSPLLFSIGDWSHRIFIEITRSNWITTRIPSIPSFFRISRGFQYRTCSELNRERRLRMRTFEEVESNFFRESLLSYEIYLNKFNFIWMIITWQ